MRIGDLIVDGVALGAGYAVLAIGWTVLLGAARLVNFSTGQLYMLGGFLSWWITTNLGIPYYWTLPLVVVGGAVIGLVTDLLLSRLIAQKNLVSIMLATLAIGFVIQGISELAFRGSPVLVPSPLADGQLDIVGSHLPYQDALIIVVAVALYLAVWLVLRKTRVGGYVRAVSEDSALASLYGISPSWVYAGIIAFAGGAAALAGWAITPRGPLLTSVGFNEVIITFAVVVLGGIGRIWGNFVAAIGLGIFVTLIGQIWVPGYAFAAAFAVVIIFLVSQRSEEGVR
jgi:branched-chain amino acid transport system permease protein